MNTTLPRRRPWSAILLACWAIGVAGGITALARYSLAPGVSAQPPTRWPSRSRIERLPGRAELVMLAHPRCPCTRASVRELDALMARCQGLLHADVLFLLPAGEPEGWARSDLWASTKAIPGVAVMGDEGGLEAKLFGAATSGQVLLYGREGNLLFEGGITPARGHSGDNAGKMAIVSLLTSGHASTKETAVFGCSLFEPFLPAQEPRHG